jgi:uncharacterized membrane protein YjgN (DUF898 family)
MDGEVDYGRYTRAQLEDALQRIDAQRYPRNHQALLAELERRRAEEAVAATAVRQEEAREGIVHHRVEFKADANEYFRIWIVNLALTIATLGIYSAWAKVRKLRYFYANTVLAGSAFGYHADPLKILRGRIIAATLFGAYVIATRISPFGTIAMLVLIAVATPWLVVKSRTFAMRVTSWRGLRFDFLPDYAGAYRVLLGYLALGVVSIGILLPLFMRERYCFIVTRGRYGSTPFECNPSTGRFYKTAFGAFGLMVGVGFFAGLLAVPVVMALKSLDPTPAVARILGLIPILLIYALMLPTVHGYTQARNLNEVFGHTSIGPHRIISKLSAASLIGIYLSNLALIVLTLGVYTPWAQVRLARYRLSALELEAHGSLEEFAAAASPAAVPAAAGEEISSFLDVDFGF